MGVAGLIGDPGMVEPWVTFLVGFRSSHAFGPLLPLRRGGSNDKAGLVAQRPGRVPGDPSLVPWTARDPGLEGEDLVGFDGPGGELVHARARSFLDEVLLGEPAGVDTGAAAGDVATVPGDSLQHPVQRVVAVGGLLAGDGAGDCVSHQEDGDFDVPALGQGKREADGIERLIGSIGGPVEDEKDLLHTSIVDVGGILGKGPKASPVAPSGPGLSGGDLGFAVRKALATLSGENIG
jgi:hypothetical protein